MNKPNLKDFIQFILDADQSKVIDHNMFHTCALGDYVRKSCEIECDERLSPIFNELADEEKLLMGLGSVSSYMPEFKYSLMSFVNYGGASAILEEMQITLDTYGDFSNNIRKLPHLQPLIESLK